MANTYYTFTPELDSSFWTDALINCKCVVEPIREPQSAKLKMKWIVMLTAGGNYES